MGMNPSISRAWRVAVAVALAWLLVPAHGALCLDLATALALARANDAGFRADVLEARARHATGWSRIASMGPRGTVSARAMRSRLDYAPDSEAEAGDRDLTFSDSELNLLVEQPLLDMEKIYTARRGRCEMEIAALERVKADEELFVRVVERYFGFLTARDEVALARAKLAFLTRQLETARSGHELGLGDQSDLYDIQGRYQGTRAALALLEARLVDARAALVEVLGQELTGEVEMVDLERVFPGPGHDIGHWLRQAEKNNIDLRLSLARAEAARLDGRIITGRFLPALSMYVEYGHNSPDNDSIGYGWDRDRTDFGLRLQMEFLSGGRDLADVVARDRTYRAARQRAIAVRRSVRRQTRANWNSLQRTLESIRFYREAVAANEKSLRIKEAGYQEGLQTMLDVLNVQKDYFAAKNDYQKARNNYAITWASFMQISGNLAEIRKRLHYSLP